jgi:hypothetical protein
MQKGKLRERGYFVQRFSQNAERETVSETGPDSKDGPLRHYSGLNGFDFTIAFEKNIYWESYL